MATTTVVGWVADMTRISIPPFSLSPFSLSLPLFHSWGTLSLGRIGYLSNVPPHPQSPPPVPPSGYSSSVVILGCAILLHLSHFSSALSAKLTLTRCLYVRTCRVSLLLGGTSDPLGDVMLACAQSQMTHFSLYSAIPIGLTIRETLRSQICF